ncbi:MAG: PorT family protein [Cyclobacteriaceae bacterium]|nr:PorT family protein [Cyclobacteriaceae bacterium]MBX2956911.1 PorT family protein [Cyclobacteriaceae bacterium]
MRAIAVLSFLLILTFGAKGQVIMSLLFGDKLNTGNIEFGLDGGVNFSNIRGLEGGAFKNSFNIGFYFDIKTKHPNWLFKTGVLVKSNLGSAGLPTYLLDNPDLDNAFAEGEVWRKINYFNVPIAMKYKVSDHFFVEGGIMPALRAKAYDYFTAEVQGNDLEYAVDIRDQIHRLDFGLLGGFGYRLFKGYGMNISFRYYYGLTDVVIDDSSADQYNTSIYLAVGIPIGVAKARARMEEKEKNKKNSSLND